MFKLWHTFREADPFVKLYRSKTAIEELSSRLSDVVHCKCFTGSLELVVRRNSETCCVYPTRMHVNMSSARCD